MSSKCFPLVSTRFKYLKYHEKMIHTFVVLSFAIARQGTILPSVCEIIQMKSYLIFKSAMCKRFIDDIRLLILVNL